MRMKDTVGIVTGASGQVIESFVGGDSLLLNVSGRRAKMKEQSKEQVERVVHNVRSRQKHMLSLHEYKVWLISILIRKVIFFWLT